MAPLLSYEELRRVSQFVNERIGFSYAPERMSDLQRGFETACQDLGLTDSISCMKAIEDPLCTSALEEALVKKLTIGETYFFRDKNLFIELRDHLLPDLFRSRRMNGKYLRIWCAACSTGEEPYSLAMLLRYLLPDIGDWDITILASDINPGSLYAAERALYSRWSFREESPVPIDRYVHPSSDGRFQISDEIRRMVIFKRLNLITDHYPSPMTGTMTMDLIFCRNVLMYFSPELASTVVDHLNGTLIDGGWFVVSPQEISYAQRPGFLQIKKSSVFLFQKVPPGELKPVNLSFSTLPVKSEIPASDEDLTDTDDLYDISSATLLPDLSERNELPSQPDTSNLIPAKLTISESLTSQSGRYETDFCLQKPEDPAQLILAGRLSEAEQLLKSSDNPAGIVLKDMHMLARMYADQGDTDRALGWCDRILAVNPLFSGAYHLRAVIQQDQGDLPAAIQSLRQALYAEPDYIPAHLMLGTILVSRGQRREARKHYQISMDLLSTMADDALVDETEGMPAARIREMVHTLLSGVTS
ncbi:MAG: hypothetical protein LUQ50_00415 [Methanospirillum sp.]|uniref:CheR family methyltransferase n=1 Tax=Methanospirillum sp. TaxID=45200 RepID=UPI00236FAAC5|nr:CheR family methyltransferase [Methanospirillum sp.]MDD1727514.1 hypothetical protein [Methanospirillum sp.]